MVGSKLDFSRRKEAHRMAVGLMDIKGQYAELQHRIEAAVLEVLRSGRVILGPNVKGFEEDAAVYMGTAGAVGVANGTDGLTIALRALGVGHGDEVITVPFTFYATAEAIAQAGAKPVFVDILPDTLCIDPAAIKRALTPRTKAIMPADLDAVRAVAEPHGLPVVEDACQAWGATYNGRRAGSLGDMGVFSFFPTKNLGGYGDGGLVTAHSKVLVQRARELRFHGSRDKKTFTDIGFNSRLDELQAAILRIELEVIDEWNARRAQVAAWYDQYLPREVLRPAVPEGLTHVYHLYVLRHPQRDAIAVACKERHVDCAAYYTRPLQLQRPGVVRGAVHMTLLAGGGDGVALRMAEHVQVVHVGEALGHGRAQHLARQVLVVPGRHLGAACIPLVDHLELDAQDRGLQFVKARVEADVGERLLVSTAVEAQLAGALHEHFAVRGDQTAVAVPAEVLGGEEAEDAHVAEAAGAPAVVGRAPSLAGVLDHG